jgi:hypothetical protein
MLRGARRAAAASSQSSICVQAGDRLGCVIAFRISGFLQPKMRWSGRGAVPAAYPAASFLAMRSPVALNGVCALLCRAPPLLCARLREGLGGRALDDARHALRVPGGAAGRADAASVQGLCNRAKATGALRSRSILASALRAVASAFALTAITPCRDAPMRCSRAASERSGTAILRVFRVCDTLAQ